MATQICVNVGSGKGLLPGSTKSLLCTNVDVSITSQDQPSSEDNFTKDTGNDDLHDIIASKTVLHF